VSPIAWRRSYGIDAWVIDAAAFSVERDPQLDLSGALPARATAVPISIHRRDPVAVAAD